MQYKKERLIKYLSLALIITLSGCAVSQKEMPEPKVVTETKLVTVEKEYTPQLWSHHKTLKETPEVCAMKGESILNSLGFKSVVKNGNYVYGNFNNNRAAIKCVKVSKQTFVYTAVAGADVKLVEKLRNEIASKL
ncbi:hypothetical protein ISG33_02685 [Glaciecola sp. MH2013]|nr:hypothetical protein [Glaciecola sp. MH2013]